MAQTNQPEAKGAMILGEPSTTPADKPATDPKDSKSPSTPDKDAATPKKPLPSSPSGLPPGWKPDPSHKDPNGERWTSPDGKDYIDFHPGTPGAPGWGGKDHWHPNGEKQHLLPGSPWLYAGAVVGVVILIVVTDGAAAPLLLAF